jgi:hypothetical protein
MQWPHVDAAAPSVRANASGSPRCPRTLLQSPVNVVAVGCNRVIVQQFIRCSMKYDADGLLVVLTT